MATFVPCERGQAFLLSPDMRDWLPDDDLARFVIAAAERVSIGACGPRGAAEFDALVRTEAIDDDDIAGAQRWDQEVSAAVSPPSLTLTTWPA